MIYQHIPSTRTSTAPYTDLFVLKETAGLLRRCGGCAGRLARERLALLPSVLVGRMERIIAAHSSQLDLLGWAT